MGPAGGLQRFLWIQPTFWEGVSEGTSLQNPGCRQWGRKMETKWSHGWRAEQKQGETERTQAPATVTTWDGGAGSRGDVSHCPEEA